MSVSWLSQQIWNRLNYWRRKCKYSQTLESSLFFIVILPYVLNGFPSDLVFATNQLNLVFHVTIKFEVNYKRINKWLNIYDAHCYWDDSLLYAIIFIYFTIYLYTFSTCLPTCISYPPIFGMFTIFLRNKKAIFF